MEVGFVDGGGGGEGGGEGGEEVCEWDFGVSGCVFSVCVQDTIWPHSKLNTILPRKYLHVFVALRAAGFDAAVVDYHLGRFEGGEEGPGDGYVEGG